MQPVRILLSRGIHSYSNLDYTGIKSNSQKSNSELGFWRLSMNCQFVDRDRARNREIEKERERQRETDIDRQNTH